MTVTVVCGMPLHTRDRDLVRAVAKMPLPQVYDHSSVFPCAQCGMMLAVGPRSTALMNEHPGAVKPYCPLCIAVMMATREQGTYETRSLGNPDVRWEEP